MINVCLADVSHISGYSTTTTPLPPPKPYSFQYKAGRYPGHIDRIHQETGDGYGIIHGKRKYHKNVTHNWNVEDVDLYCSKLCFLMSIVSEIQLFRSLLIDFACIPIYSLYQNFLDHKLFCIESKRETKNKISHLYVN